MAWQHTPLAACFVEVEDGIDDFPSFINRLRPARVGSPHEMSNRFPLLVSQIGRVSHRKTFLKIPKNQGLLTKQVLRSATGVYQINNKDGTKSEKKAVRVKIKITGYGSGKPRCKKTYYILPK